MATKLQFHNLSIQFKAEKLDYFYPRKCLTTTCKDTGTYPDYLDIFILCRGGLDFQFQYFERTLKIMYQDAADCFIGNGPHYRF